MASEGTPLNDTSNMSTLTPTSSPWRKVFKGLAILGVVAGVIALWKFNVLSVDEGDDLLERDPRMMGGRKFNRTHHSVVLIKTWYYKGDYLKEGTERKIRMSS